MLAVPVPTEPNLGTWVRTPTLSIRSICQTTGKRETHSLGQSDLQTLNESQEPEIIMHTWS